MHEVSLHLRHGKVFIVRSRGEIIASMCLTRKKPSAIEAPGFTPVRMPLYLTAMVVAPPFQGRGIGRRCLLEADQIAAAWPAQAIRLEIIDRPDAAGIFYERCGYREVGRTMHRNTPRIYYERLLSSATRWNSQLAR